LGEFFDADKLVVKDKEVQQFIVVDEDRREVLAGGKELQPSMTGNELELILLLYKNQGKAVPHEEIMDWVWREVTNRDTILRQDVNTLAHRLRKSLREHGKYIENIPSYGYRLDPGDS
jgi:DNA-binding winged helix-turn-helix (wHTH) protein